MPWTASVGSIVGRVSANDADAGADGRIAFSLQESSLPVGTLHVDAKSGAIRLAAPLVRTANRTLETLVIMAASSAVQMSRVSVTLDTFDDASLFVDEYESVDNDAEDDDAIKSGLGKLAAVDRLVLGAVAALAFVLLIFALTLCVCSLRRRGADRRRSRPRKQVYSVARG